MPERDLMKKTDNLRKRIFQWYRGFKRSLPWRSTDNPYKIWISEIMLQQTTVNTVIPYYSKWIQSFPDIKTLSKAPLQKVLKAWEGLGYYQRARNIHKTALILTKRFDGKLPPSYKELLRLPGIGPYTAAAIMSIAFGKRFKVLDANVKRLCVRLLCQKKIQEKKILVFLEELLPKRDIGTFNQALMELGALICRPQKPTCPLCPLSDFCISYKRGLQDTIPVIKKQVYENIEAVLAVIQKNGRILIQKRPSYGRMADLFEFPTEEKNKGEIPEEALLRMLRKEQLPKAQKVEFLGRVIHSYTRFRVSLYAYLCTLENKKSLKKNSRRKLWVKRGDLKNYPFTSGGTKVIALLKKTSMRLKS